MLGFLVTAFMLALSPFQKDLPAFKAGDPLPQFSAVTAAGDSVSTESLRGKVVFIDFWASWCLPCRKQNVNMVKLHERMMSRSKSRNRFMLLSISLDTREDLWKIAVAKDELRWKTHICDLKGWDSPLAATFRVTHIPASFLVNEQGEIVATNIWGRELDDALLTLMP
jgi:thiol-disulfide isomerase/thioredoxin